MGSIRLVLSFDIILRTSAETFQFATQKTVDEPIPLHPNSTILAVVENVVRVDVGRHAEVMFHMASDITH
jgi:hypothetical protein